MLNSQRNLLRLLLALLSLGLTLAGSGTAAAGGVSGSTIVVPPKAKVQGSTYSEWNAKWWKWLYQTPTTQNPVFGSDPGTSTDPVPVDCSAGQNGRVWFLGGTFVPTVAQSSRFEVHRTCTVPQGTYLFFPILNSEADNLLCPDNTSGPLTAQQLIAATSGNINDVVAGSMFATINSADVSGLENSGTRYRSLSPWFSYRLPAENVGQQFCGVNFQKNTKPPQVDHHGGAIADGIYLMLALPRGTYAIHYGGIISSLGGTFLFEQDITYTITVTGRCWGAAGCGHQ